MPMRRRAFIAALGGAAAWPLVARAQQSAVPVVCYLQFGATRGDLTEGRARAFLFGLSQAGFNNGRNVIVDPIPVPNQDRLPAIVAKQVERHVAVIYGILISAIAAKAATSTIPIVFASTDDPISVGLVSSYNKPGGNVTGVQMRAGDEPAKLIELLHEILPTAETIGALVFRGNTGWARDAGPVEAAARSMAMRIHTTVVSNEDQFEGAFAGFSEAKVSAVLVGDDRYLDARRERIVALAIQRELPIAALPREFSVAGGLVSYGADLNDSIRQAGIYVGRILNGENPGDLPVSLPTKFVLAVNLKTAKVLGLTVPPTLLARADEVIE
jgi:putative tryptophan/tyrosine transport system substrate-binding protein